MTRLLSHFSSVPLRAKWTAGLCAALAGSAILAGAVTAVAQEQLPWGQSERPRVIQPGDQGYGSGSERHAQRQGAAGGFPANRSYDDQDEPPPPRNRDYRPAVPVYPVPSERSYGDRSYDNGRYGGVGPGRPYEPTPNAGDRDEERRTYRPRDEYGESRTYSSNEIKDAGHRFFGSITSGLASVIEYAFKHQGRPNGYILGEEGSGAFVAGLRYGEGTLHMKDGTRQKVYWQGPTVGYDFGAEGSKTMILVYELDHPGMIYQTFGGISGSAYLVGGVGITFMKNDHVVLAPIRSGLGLRIGANVGYLKYTRAPTWNPF